jgi:C4-dicarboxylate-specific signal transduction histidine kinase
LDVTARKNAEQALKDQLQALAHMARVSTLGELSAALAHELNQPLTAILCNAQAGKRILMQLPPDQEELSAILSDIAEDDRRAGTVVSRLRALFKKEDGVQQVLNINALVEEVAQLLRSEFITKQVFLNLQLGVDLPRVKGDPVQMRQVLLNLTMNGIEAMTTPSGPHRLRICTSMHDADSLEVIVLDTGPGINPQMLEQIFEPFVTGKSQGLGMGLAISRTIVKAHGGRIWAENDPGGGAALRFTLPVFQGCNP